MPKTAAIAGAGIIGRLMAFALNRRGWNVELFDKDGADAAGSCTFASAGMLAPSCELESAEPEVAALGTASLALWPDLLESFAAPVYFEHKGSVVVAHPQDRELLDALRKKVQAKAGITRPLSAEEIRELEPELGSRFDRGLYMMQEAQVDNRQALEALRQSLEQAGVVMHWDTEVEIPKPRTLKIGNETHTFDWVIDCRGMGAQKDLGNLRGIRGELIIVHAPEVNLRRPIRLMHPRYPIYIVPREDHHYLIGATAIECEDYSPISVRSAMELLSAAYTVHPGFAEARLLETVTNCRPAFPDNRPRLIHRDGLLRINGLYRHGFLLAPIIIQFALEYLEHGTQHPDSKGIWVAGA